MNFFTLLTRPKAKRPRVLPPDRIAVYGRVQGGPLLLARADLDRTPEGERTPDVRAYAHGETGRAVRLKAVCEMARPVPGSLYVNFMDRSGRRRLSHFLTEVRDLGWIAYAEKDDIGPDGAFRLVLPGIPIERGRVSDLAWIEFADEPAD